MQTDSWLRRALCSYFFISALSIFYAFQMRSYSKMIKISEILWNVARVIELFCIVYSGHGARTVRTNNQIIMWNGEKCIVVYAFNMYLYFGFENERRLSVGWWMGIDGDSSVIC